MAPPICAKTPTAEEVKGLKTIYNALFIVNKRVGEAERDIVRLMTTKRIWHSKSSTKADRQEFDKYRGQAEKDPICDINRKEWLDWARDHGVFDSLDLLNIELEKANAEKAEHESISAALRLSADNLSRPYLRRLTILDLPDEILLEIFDVLEGLNHNRDDLMPPWLFDRPNVKDIKNARLICQRFCRLSSQLLVCAVSVTPEETSLARLEEISRHPKISKGVRNVQVVLRLHSPDLADFDNFVSYLAHHLGQALQFFDRPRSCEFWSTTEQIAAETVANGRKFEHMLRRFSAIDVDDSDPDDTNSEGQADDRRELLENDGQDFAHIRNIYAQYKLILEKEQSLIQSGRFSRSIGQAIARMPPGRSLRRLHVDDRIMDWSTQPALLNPRVDIKDTAKTFMLRSLTTGDRINSGLDLPDYGFIVLLIDAVRVAGVLLDSIHLRISSLGKEGSLVLDPSIRAQFSSGMQQLRRFSFLCDEADPDQQYTMDNLEQFLSACVDTPSLERLMILLGNRNQGTEMIDVGEIMGTRSRSDLKDISLWSVALDASKLKVMLKQLPESMNLPRIYLQDVNLRNGTWKETLDAMRGKCKLTLEDPSGAECADMSREEYEDVFGTWGGEEREHNSDAEIYVNHPNSTWCKTNPIQALEEKRLPSGNDDSD